MSPSDLLALAPLLVTTLTALGILIAGVLLPRRARPNLAFVAVGGMLLAGASALPLWGSDRLAFQGAFRLDSLSLFVDGVLLVGGIISVLLAKGYLEQPGIAWGEHLALILFALVGGMLMAGAGDLLILFLGIEILSLSLYVLAGFRRTDLGSQEAALKYFLLGAFASGFLVYGAALLFGGSGTTHLEGIRQAAAGASGGDRSLLLAGMGLLAVGLAFKVALVPFHMWTPDVYEGAPTSVAAFMSVAAKAAGFAALVRVFVYGLGPLAGAWVPLLVVLAALTMSLGNIVALAQTNLKRLLAYSSIAHAGYVVLGVVSGGSWGVSSALFYLLAYTFSNLGAFAVVAAMREGDRELLSLNQYAGLGSRRPLLAAAMAVFLLSLAGVPPTAGFLAKLFVLGAAVQSGQIVLALVAVANGAVAAFYYLRVILIMYMRPAPSVELKVATAPSLALALLLAAWGTLQLGILPHYAIDLAQRTFVATLGS